MSKSKTKNRLASETSPYLQQHATNPVDWYPWGSEALTRAKKLNRPIFLSIGYSACHWCHVMEHESFEDEGIAALLNSEFVPIKVDREERPDLDHIYMSAVQAMTQRGGWPLNVFLTPEQKPFYGGTYFPPVDKHGLPSFKKILVGVAGAWKTRSEEVEKSAAQLTGALGEVGQLAETNPTEALDFAAIRDGAVQQILSQLDSEEGGLGQAPKFFHSGDFRLLLRHFQQKGELSALSATTFTLNRWAGAGIRDQLGGGFHRYSTDREWLVPHFEKMLYDNALLTVLFLEAYQQTAQVEYAEVASSTLDFVLREMQSTQGGYYSTQDADSEGVEGKFYTWTKEEISQILDGETSTTFQKVYGISSHGNWEGTNVLHRTQTWSALAANLEMEQSWLEDTMSAARRKLFAARQARIRPGTDEKILVSWNGLMSEAMAKAAMVLNDSRYLESARRNLEFLWSNLWDDSAQRLQHTYKDGRASQTGFLDDYASLALAFLAMFEASSERRDLERAGKLLAAIEKHFKDPTEKDLFYTPDFHETLILRPKEFQDGATPSATALAITAFVRYGKLTGESRFLSVAEAWLKRNEVLLQRAPQAASQMILALSDLSAPSTEVIISGAADSEISQALLEVAREGFHPNRIVLRIAEEDSPSVPLFEGRAGLKPIAYVCQGRTCLAPVESPEKLREVLQTLP